MRQCHQPLNVVDTWPYYEFEDYIKLLNDSNEEERKQQEDQEKKSGSANYGDMMKNVKQPNIQMPKFNMPKF